MSENNNCPICLEESHDILTTTLRRGEGKVLKCSACDHGFLVNNQISNFKEYYATEYRNEYSHKANANSTEAQELFDTYVKYQDYRLKPILPFLSTEKNLLEIGASAGQFIYHIRDKVNSIQAIELDKTCFNYLVSKHEIDSDSHYFEESKFKNNKYDIICSFQVMEHVPNPIEFLKTIYDALNDNGVAIIEVPNLHDPLLSIWDIPLYQSFYYHSAHLQYFSGRSLLNTAQKAGFNPNKASLNFIQDYNIINHIHWATSQTPQETCHIGLSPVTLKKSKDSEIANWLETELRELNKKYIQKLSEQGLTSNIMIILKK